MVIEIEILVRREVAAVVETGRVGGRRHRRQSWKAAALTLAAGNVLVVEEERQRMPAEERIDL